MSLLRKGISVRRAGFLFGVCLSMLWPAFASALESSGANSESHEAGRAIYNYRCYFCHGYSGDARTLTSTYVSPSPRDFTATTLEELDRATMIDVVTNGKPKTAMHGFDRLLSSREVEQVVDFVRDEFMQNKRENTRYHTPENGWNDHDRYALAFPFAKGEILLDTPWEELDQEQRQGKQLFMTSCVSCHDRAKVKDEGPAWSSQSISYPRNNFSYSQIDTVSGASIYAIHDQDPVVPELNDSQSLGRELWKENCAFCHAADGTGENWIGSFLEPKPRNLTKPQFMKSIDRAYLDNAIRKGLINTSMPAWESVLSDEQISAIIDYIDVAFHPVNQ